ncbi:MAG: hypothetical protein Q8N70_11265 [Deltaproteobacteria bacterium]|nr:hypothetical protein [Deltaproteobacteria bacterium]
MARSYGIHASTQEEILGKRGAHFHRQSTLHECDERIHESERLTRINELEVILTKKLYCLEFITEEKSGSQGSSTRERPSPQRYYRRS